MALLTAILYPHTCELVHRVAASPPSVDSMNQPVPVDDSAAVESCRLEDGGTREVLNHYVATIEGKKLFLPITSGILENDAVQNIKDGDANVIAAGPFEVSSISEYNGNPIASVHHFEVRLGNI